MDNVRERVYKMRLSEIIKAEKNGTKENYLSHIELARGHRSGKHIERDCGP
jgi:hypothetical protein